jgi:hypothetical protein
MASYHIVAGVLETRLMDWNTHINSLVIWANQRGYHVDIVKKGDNSICRISKIIEINASSHPEKQLIRLAHECGHALIFDNGSNFNFENANPEGSTKNKVYTVMEEIEAWKRGRELLKRLKIPINEEAWEKDMVSALKKYINWAADLKEKGGKNEDKNRSTKRKSRSSQKST